MAKHVITFDKEKHAIFVDGALAGYIDGSASMSYEAREDEHGLKVIVSETIDLGTPLPDGRKSLTVPLVIFRPYIVEETRARAKVERKEHLENLGEMKWRSPLS